MASWRNWAGNQEANPSQTITPRGVADVVTAVHSASAQGLTVKATDRKSVV